MAGRMDNRQQSGIRDGGAPSLHIVRPCPLCNELMEFEPHSSPQIVVCDACGLACTIDLPAPKPAILILEIEELIEAPPVAEDGDDVVQWLQRPPGPILPSPDFAAKQASARRRQLAMAAGVAGAAALAIAVLSGYLGYHQASDELALRQQTAELREYATVQQLSDIRQRLERERQTAEAQRASAERNVRVVTSKYLAAQSQELAASQPWKSVALAAEAVRSTLDVDGVVVPEAHQSLRDALQQCATSHDLDAIELRGHAGPITSIAVSPDGRWLATASRDRTARLWDLSVDRPQRSGVVLNIHQKPVASVLFTGDGASLITGSRDATACIWQLGPNRPAEIPVILPGKGQPISQLALSPNGRWLAAVSTEGGAETGLGQLWSLAAGPASAVSMELTGHAGQIQTMAMGPGNRWLALGVDDSVKLWDLTAGDPAAASVERRCRQGRVKNVLFTNDGQWLITCGNGRGSAVRMWNLASSDPSDSFVLAGVDGAVAVAATSADSRYLAIAGADRQLRLWDLGAIQASTLPTTLPAGDADVTSLSISADNRWLALASADGSIRLWRLVENRIESQSVVLEAGDKAINSLAFAPDGRWLVAAGDDWTARLWNLDVAQLTAAAEKFAHTQMHAAALAAREATITDAIRSIIPTDMVQATLPGAIWSAARGHAPAVKEGWKPWLLDQLSLPEEPKIAAGPRPTEVGAVASPATDALRKPEITPTKPEKPSLMVAMPETDPAPRRPAVSHEWPVRSIVKRSVEGESEPRTAAKPATTLEIHTR